MPKPATCHPETFGQALRAARTAKGLGLRALARSLGVSHVYLSQVETGARSTLTPERLAQVADALGLDATGRTALEHAAAAARREWRLETGLSAEHDALGLLLQEHWCTLEPSEIGHLRTLITSWKAGA